jgi:hypothetical protein
MTIGEAIIEVYEHTGEPSDLDPYLTTSSPPYTTTDLDTSSYGYLKLADYIDRGIRRILTYKFSNYRFRFDDLKKRILWTPVINSFTDTKVSTNVLQFNTGLTAVQAAEYIGNQYILTGENDGVTTTDLTDQFFTIVDYTWNDANPYGVDFSTDKDLTDYVTQTFAEIREAEKGYDLPSDLQEILKVVTFEDSNELEYLSRQQTEFYETDPQVSLPVQFYRFKNTIVFDSVPEINTRYWLEYIAFFVYDTATVSNSLPFRELFDQAIIQWANYWVHSRMHEPERAAFAKRDFEKEMQTIQQVHEFRHDRTDDGRGSVKKN